ncbi:FAD-binding protein [Actinoplanes bogorensis]|uniref:FAD-binding protein n=1 Tax=Paractinoplanes bogorensis TaxID=1610840 RepID=A0ABS5YU83_9ACTN|nr:FAD-binding protein [Actinoplanes bogorensis]MBU2667014.1 FAD-binding protein [Actinoplanes bogorensis]
MSVLHPGDDGFDAELATDNQSLTHRPSTVVSAHSAADVASAVALAKSRGESVGVQATGHGMSVASDGVLVVTRHLNRVEVDISARRARICAGARGGDVLAATVPHGLAPLHGSSPTVGTTGFTLGGGVGPLGRMHGYGADHVRRLRMVSGDGVLREVGPEDELFSVVRGSKGLLGIVTDLEVELFPIADFLGGGLVFDGAAAAEVMTRYVGWTSGNPRETSTSLLLATFPDVDGVPPALRGRSVAHLRFAHFGDTAEGARLLGHMRSVAPILMDTVRMMPYADIAQVHNDPTGPYRVFESGFFVGSMGSAGVEALVGAAHEHAMVVELRHHGGAYGDRPARPNVVRGRDAEFTVYLGSVPELGSAPRDRATHSGVRSAFGDGDRGTVLNFLGVGADPAWVRDAFEPDACQRLVRLKQVVDPENIFRVNHTPQGLFHD